MIRTAIIFLVAFAMAFGIARWVSGTSGASQDLHDAETVAALTAISVADRGRNSSGRTVEEAAAWEWFHNDWERALVWLASLPEDERSKYEWQFAKSSLRNPVGEGAVSERLEWAENWLSDERNRGRRAGLGYSLGGRFVEIMAKEDPVAALAWARENLSGQTLASAVGKVLKEGFGEDAGAGISLVESLPPGGVRLGAARSVAYAILESDVTEAFRWAAAEAELSDGEQGDWWAYFGKAAAKKDIEATKQILANEPFGEQVSFRGHSMWLLLEADAEGTMDWAIGVGGERGDALVKEGLESWERQDATAAEIWRKANGVEDAGGG